MVSATRIIAALAVECDRFVTGELASKYQSDLIWAMMADHR
jgi:hypothetical protein